MSSVQAVRFLGNEAGTDESALALKGYAGGVASRFREESILFDQSADKFLVKSIAGHRSEQFLKFADTPDPEDHTPGDELGGQAYAFDETVISVDDFLVAHHYIPFDQAMLSHFSPQGPLASQDGYKVGREYDKRTFNTLINAARTSATTKNGLGVDAGGIQKTRTAASVALAYPLSSTGAANFRADLEDTARQLDEAKTPGDRTVWITPYIRQVLGQDPTIFDIGYSRTQNDLNKRIIGELAGMTVQIAVDRFETTNVTRYTRPSTSKYNCDCSIGGAFGTPVAVIACGSNAGRPAVGILRAENVRSHMEPVETKNAWFVKSQILAGVGKLYCASSAVIQVHT